MSERLPHDVELSEDLPSLEEELLAVFTEEQEPEYPGNPGDPEAEAYFSAIEAEFSLFNGLNSHEIYSQAESFLSCLRQFWDSVNEG
jgi:hypothetical protein